MTNSRALLLIAFATVCSACQDAPESRRELGDDESTFSPFVVNVTSLKQIENKLWQRNVRGLNDDFVNYLYHEPDGRTWLLNRSFAGDDSCFYYEAYFGQYVPKEDNIYTVDYFGGDEGDNSLSEVDGRLIVQEVGRSDRGVWLPAQEDFNELPPLCEVEHASLDEDADPLTSIAALEGHWLVRQNSKFSEDRFEWIINQGRETYFDYVGDALTRADDCNDPYGFIAFYYHLGENRFLRVGRDGDIEDLRYYERDDTFIQASTSGIRTRLKGDLTLAELEGNVCANRFDPPANSSALEEFSQALGLWDLGYLFDDGDFDSYYFYIKENGDIDLYDNRNDSVDQGEMCADIYENVARISPNDNGSYTWFLDEDVSFFSRILLDTIELFRQDNDLILADRYVTRTLRSTELTLDDLPPCYDGDSDVPVGAAPQRNLEMLVGVYDFSEFDNSGNRLSTEYSVIDDDGFIVDYSLNQADMCFEEFPSYFRIQQSEPFIFDISRITNTFPQHEFFVYENSVLGKTLDGTSLSFDLPVSDISQSEIAPLCEAPEPPPAGFVEVNDPASFSGVWSIESEGVDFLFKVSADGSLLNLRKFTDVPSFDQHCFYPDDEFSSVEPGLAGPPIFNFPNGGGLRRRVFVSADTLILQDPFFTDILTLTDLTDTQAQASCPTIEDIPVDSEEVTTLAQISSLWDRSTEPFEGIVDEKFADISAAGVIETVDYLGDDFDDDDPCFIVYEGGRLEFITEGENTLRFVSPDGEADIYDAFIVDGDLLLADDSRTLTFKATSLAREDLIPACSESVGSASVGLVNSAAQTPASESKSTSKRVDVSARYFHVDKLHDDPLTLEAKKLKVKR